MSKKSQTPILKPIDIQQQKVRDFFKDVNSPFLYLSYDSFLRNFKPQSFNFKDQNRNIIDVHLRYRWWVRQKMAPYKWLPIFMLTPLLFHNYFFVLLVPWFTTKMFDHYFQRFFLWRYRNERIINMRKEFFSKLSKQKYKIRRLALFQALQNKFKPDNEEKLEAPAKYIKFGEFTEYIFHALTNGRQQSSISQTTLYQTYLSFRNIFWQLSSPTTFFGYFKTFKDDFLAFRKDPDKSFYLLNINELVQRSDLKEAEIYTFQDNIDHNVRRWKELFNYILRGDLSPSTFKLWQHTNLTTYQDIFQPSKYNVKDNWADLSIYYFVLGIPKLIKVIFTRR